MFRISVRHSFIWLPLLLVSSFGAFAQETANAPAKQPLDHVLGAITAINPAAHTVTVLEDKTNTSYTIQLADTKSFLKVEPGAKDLTNAQRITADDLQVGDRVDVRGRKADPSSLTARGLVLMSARDLQKAHQEQAAAWQKATAGTVSELDAASGKITVSARTAEGPKPLTIETSKATEFTRYSPDSPKTPAPSQLAQIQPGDQIRVIGDKSEDGTTVKAQRVYTGAFRTLSATVTSIGPDGKSLIIKDLATKKPIQVSLNDDSAIRKLNPMMAMMLARRFNPSYKPADTAGAAPAGSTRARRHLGPRALAAAILIGNAAQVAAAKALAQAAQVVAVECVPVTFRKCLTAPPKFAITDLKPGDALVVSGVALGGDNSKLLGTDLIAGVEPILQSAPQRQNSMASDWGLGEMSAPQ